MSAEELKQLVATVEEALRIIEKPLREQLERLDKIIPRGVVDPRRWITVHQPELLEDKKLVAALEIWETLGGKQYRRKALRKKSNITYAVTFEGSVEVFEEIIQTYIVDYEYSRYLINMGKSLLEDLEYAYSSRAELHLTSNSLGMVIKGFTNLMEEFPDIAKDDPEEATKFLSVITSFLKSKVQVRKSVTVPTLKEDGTLEFKFEHTESETDMVSVLEGQLKKSKLREALKERGS